MYVSTLNLLLVTKIGWNFSCLPYWMSICMSWKCESWSYNLISIVIYHQVCLRSCPLYHPGSIGINISSGIPRMGQLLESAWNLDEKCRFKVLPLGNEEASCNPPVLDEQDSDIPGSLGLSELLVATFSEHAQNFMISIFLQLWNSCNQNASCTIYFKFISNYF